MTGAPQATAPAEAAEPVVTCRECGHSDHGLDVCEGQQSMGAHGSRPCACAGDDTYLMEYVAGDAWFES